MKTFALSLTTVFSATPAFATHVYANDSCSNKMFELNYDGPGSNYAVGGYSHSIRKEDHRDYRYHGGSCGKVRDWTRRPDQNDMR